MRRKNRMTPTKKKITQSRTNITPLLMFAGGLLVGSLAGSLMMFAFDPVQGRSRRARVRDKAVSTQKRVSRFADRKSRDLSNRLDGVKASINKLSSFNSPADPSGIH